MAERKDFSRQGPMFLADNLGSGKPGAMRWLGDTGTANISVTQETEQRKENFSGQRGISVVLNQGNEVTIELNLRYDSAENLALGLHGKLSNKPAGTVTAETLPTVIAGDVVMLAYGAATNIVLTDSTPTTPVPLVAGTHYIVRDAAAGLIDIVSVTEITLPIKAAYSYGASKNLSVLTTKPPVKYFYMAGINTVDGSRDRFHLYKVQFEPLANLGLIDESLGEFTITGRCLIDTVNVLDPDLGGYGRIEQLEAEVTP